MTHKASAEERIRHLPQQVHLTTVPEPGASCPVRPPALLAATSSAHTPVSVAVTATDLLTEEGARSWLEAADEVRVTSWDEREQAQIAVVLAHEVTSRVLARVEEMSRRTGGERLPVLLVADDVTERQLLEAVDRGVVGLLARHGVSYAAIVGAVRSAVQGESLMPPTMVRTLIDRVRVLKAEDRPETGALTSREVDVLRLLADGLSTAEVASRLNYSERTIKNILHDVVARLKLRNRTQAVAYAIRTGVL
ncbi:LuxR C-terminal-related transcriptional regulator [Streptomyces sp. NPDC057694]|uniref:helix-turn-helix transcriptional regulator n=1 Tax=Streptomyces sp. NPDC057694 TaxID=3346216 RepID=UPI0036B6EF81